MLWFEDGRNGNSCFVNHNVGIGAVAAVWSQNIKFRQPVMAEGRHQSPGDRCEQLDRTSPEAVTFSEPKFIVIMKMICDTIAHFICQTLILTIWQMLTYLILPTTLWVGTIILIAQMRKLRHREVKHSAWSHTAGVGRARMLGPLILYEIPPPGGVRGCTTRDRKLESLFPCLDTLVAPRSPARRSPAVMSHLLSHCCPLQLFLYIPTTCQNYFCLRALLLLLALLKMPFLYSSWLTSSGAQGRSPWLPSSQTQSRPIEPRRQKHTPWVEMQFHHFLALWRWAIFLVPSVPQFSHLWNWVINNSTCLTGLGEE